MTDLAERRPERTAIAATASAKSTERTRDYDVRVSGEASRDLIWGCAPTVFVRLLV